MDWRSIYRSSFPFTGMASAMSKAVRTAQMLNIQVVQRFATTKVQRLINCLS